MRGRDTCAEICVSGLLRACTPPVAAILVVAFSVAALPVDVSATTSESRAQTGLEERVDRVVALSDSLRRVARADSALLVLEDALNEVRAARDSLSLARLLTQKGGALVALGRARDAEATLWEAIETADAVPDSTILCEALYQQGFAIDAQGRPPRLLPILERLIATASAIRDTLHIARGNLLLARRMASTGRYEEARGLFELALANFRQLGDQRNELNTIYLLGIVKISTGDREGARAAWEQSLNMARRLESRMMEAGSLSNLATLEVRFGDPGLGARQFQEAHELYVADGRMRAAIRPASNAVAVLQSLGRYREAEESAHTLLELTREQGYTDLEVRQLALLGDIALSQEQFNKSASRYREAQTLQRVANVADVGMEVLTLLGLGRSLSGMDSTSQALTLFEEGAEQLRGRCSTTDRMALDGLRAALLIELKRYEAALAILSRIEVEALELGSSLHHIQFLPKSAEAYLGLGRPDSALACLQRAAAVWQSQREVPQDLEWREQRGSHGVVIYTQLADLMLHDSSGGTPAERVRNAFDLLQRFKARTLLERMQDPSLPSDSARDAATPVTLAHLQDKTLQDGELLVDAFVGPRVCLLFAVTRDSCRVLRLPGLEEKLAGQLEVFRSILATRPPMGSSTVRAAAHEEASARLGQLLLGKVTDMLRTSRRILFVPDGPLNLVPLSTLAIDIEGSGSEQPLLLQRDLVHFPSATVLARLREKPRARSAEASVMAIAGRVTERGERLAGAIGEVRRLGRRFADVDVFVGSGSDSLTAARMPQYDVLHLAAHTRVDDQRPWRSGILLAGTGAGGGRVREQAGVTASPQPALRAAHIANMHLPARLAVLSGCESAGGRVLAGEGVLGLTGAFLSAGVSAIVATLWPVDDTVTARLMDRFYGQLAAGESVAAALRQAQSDIRARRETAHPFYWAGFVVLGAGDIGVDLQERVPSQRRLLGIGTLIAAILLLGIWGWRRSAGSRKAPAGV